MRVQHAGVPAYVSTCCFCPLFHKLRPIATSLSVAMCAYRPQVENPIPFANSALTRTLSTGYLHAKYASLLVAPVQLSADWSFECVPLVEGLSDPRNLITAATYTWLLWTLCSIRPWQTVVELWQQLTGMPFAESR